MRVDRSKFKNSPYIKKIPKPWGYEMHFTSDNLPYMGKILHIKKGQRLSLQLHDKKMESWFKLKGRVMMIMENDSGEMENIEMKADFGYTTHTGQKHRLMGITNCDILEVSTPEIGNTYRLEDDYARGTETDEIRKDPNRGWKN